MAWSGHSGLHIHMGMKAFPNFVVESPNNMTRNLTRQERSHVLWPTEFLIFSEFFLHKISSVWSFNELANLNINWVNPFGGNIFKIKKIKSICWLLHVMRLFCLIHMSTNFQQCAYGVFQNVQSVRPDQMQHPQKSPWKLVLWHHCTISKQKHCFCCCSCFYTPILVVILFILWFVTTEHPQLSPSISFLILLFLWPSSFLYF